MGRLGDGVRVEEVVATDLGWQARSLDGAGAAVGGREVSVERE